MISFVNMERDETLRVRPDDVMNAVSWDQYSRFRRGTTWACRFDLQEVRDLNDSLDNSLVFSVQGDSGSYDVTFRESIIAPCTTVCCSCPDPFVGLCKHMCWVIFKVLKHDDLAVFDTGLVPMELTWHVAQNEDAQARLAELWKYRDAATLPFPGRDLDREPSFAAWNFGKRCPFLQTPSWPPDNLECAVCFEDMEQEQAKQCPGCSNSFHDVCITKWFEHKRSCPLCRKTFC